MSSGDPGRDEQRLAELRSFLGALNLRQPAAMKAATPAIHELLGVERFASYGFEARGEGLTAASRTWAGFDGRRLFELLDRWLREQPVVGWTAFNPIRPEPRQRNRVMDLADIEAASGIAYSATPLARAIFTRVGLTDVPQLRVLVCEGASLLRWVGGWQPEAFSPRQRTLLQRLVPALRRRLIVERQLAAAPHARGLIEGLLEALGRPAFIVDARGTVDELNESARALIEREGREVLASLRDSVLARPAARAFDLTEISAPGMPRRYVAVARAETSGVLDAQVLAAAQRFGLTDRQREVLARVVRGETNVTIAANLGIAERTVEVHMTAIMARAGVGNRAELVGRVLLR